MTPKETPGIQPKTLKVDVSVWKFGKESWLITISDIQTSLIEGLTSPHKIDIFLRYFPMRLGEISIKVSLRFN
jgi:hypothetical protein